MDRISMITALFARALAIKSIGGDSLSYIGVTTTALSDGATTNPITIDGDTVTATGGNVALYGSDAFVFNGTIWQASSAISQIFAEIGDLSDLDTEAKTDLVSAINEVNEEKQDDVELSLTPTAVVSDRDIIDGQGNTLSVLAEALTKTASGNPVVITDCAGGKARSLITSINAIQDLHGYDHPWAGGAGKNKFGGAYNTIFPLFVASGTTVTVSCKSDGTTMIEYVDQNNTRIDYWSVSVPVTGETGRYSKTFQLTADAYGFKFYGGNVECTNMQIEISDTATSYAPYSNICPISGHTEESVERDGRNLLDNTSFSDTSFTRGGVTFTKIEEGHYRLNGTCTTTLWTNLVSGGDSVTSCKQPVGTYIAPSDSKIRTYLYYGDDLNTSRYVTSTNSTVSVKNEKLQGIRWLLAQGSVFNNFDLYAQIEEGNMLHDFKPYEGIAITIALGQTVYGADINWDTGVMTVKTAVVDMGSLEWFRANTHRFQSTGLNGLIYPNSDNVIPPDMKCEIYKPFAASQTPTTDFGITAFHFTSDNTTYLRALDANIDDLTTFMALIDGKKLEYKLATPTSIQLTPTQLQMLKGYNRVTIDNGTITLDYVSKADSIQAEVDALDVNKAEKTTIAPVENGTKASKAYAVGEHFQKNDKFCTAIAAIASGATLTKNTNYVEGTIADNLIKQATFSGTTTANGNVLLHNSLNRKILCAISDTANQIVTIYPTSSEIWGHVTQNSAEVPVVANTAVSGTYYYI